MKARRTLEANHPSPRVRQGNDAVFPTKTGTSQTTSRETTIDQGGGTTTAVGATCQATIRTSEALGTRAPGGTEVAHPTAATHPDREGAARRKQDPKGRTEGVDHVAGGVAHRNREAVHEPAGAVHQGGEAGQEGGGAGRPIIGTIRRTVGATLEIGEVVHQAIEGGRGTDVAAPDTAVARTAPATVETVLGTVGAGQGNAGVDHRPPAVACGVVVAHVGATRDAGVDLGLVAEHHARRIAEGQDIAVTIAGATSGGIGDRDATHWPGRRKLSTVKSSSWIRPWRGRKKGKRGTPASQVSVSPQVYVDSIVAISVLEGRRCILPHDPFLRQRQHLSCGRSFLPFITPEATPLVQDDLASFHNARGNTSRAVYPLSGVGSSLFTPRGNASRRGVARVRRGPSPAPHLARWLLSFPRSMRTLLVSRLTKPGGPSDAQGIQSANTIRAPIGRRDARYTRPLGERHPHPRAIDTPCLPHRAPILYLSHARHIVHIHPNRTFELANHTVRDYSPP